MKISVIIPMFNESLIAKEYMDKLAAYMYSAFDDWEVVMSNDGSTDNTKTIINEIAKADNHFVVSSYDNNRGKGSAIREGILKSSGDVVVYTDCDLAYGCEVIKDISDKLISCGSDIVIGSRAIHPEGYSGYSFARKLASKSYLKILSVVCGFKHTDSQTGLKCFKGDVARNIFSKCEINGFAFDLEALMIAEKLGYTIEEFPAKILNNRESDSRVSLFSDAKKMLCDIKKIKKRLKTFR